MGSLKSREIAYVSEMVHLNYPYDPIMDLFLTKPYLNPFDLGKGYPSMSRDQISSLAPRFEFVL